MKHAAPKRQRCAIYTRKSTEHNLDLAFNSLDAQREACEAGGLHAHIGFVDSDDLHPEMMDGVLGVCMRKTHQPTMRTLRTIFRPMMTCWI